MPTTIPLWLTISGVVLIYLVAHSPVSSLKTAIAVRNPRVAAVSGLMEAILIIGVGYFVYVTFPEAKEFMEKIPHVVESFIHSLRDYKNSP